MEAECGQNPLIYQKWLFLAAKLEADPSLLEIPLCNIGRWMKGGRLGNITPLEWWRERILRARESEQGMEELLAILRCDDDEIRRMKSCSPFPGVLGREERDRFTCAWTH